MVATCATWKPTSGTSATWPVATWVWLRPCRSPSVGSSADRHVSYKDSHGGSVLRQQLSFFINHRVPRISNPIQPNLVNMSSGATSSESESGRMVIQAPFIIAPTHQTTIAASKIKESASVGSQEEEDGPQPLVMSGPSGAGTFEWFSFLRFSLTLLLPPCVCDPF